MRASITRIRFVLSLVAVAVAAGGAPVSVGLMETSSTLRQQQLGGAKDPWTRTLTRLDVTPEGQNEEHAQTIVSRAIVHYQPEAHSDASQTSDIFDHSWAALRTPDSQSDASSVADQEHIASGSIKRKSGAPASPDMGSKRQARDDNINGIASALEPSGSKATQRRRRKAIPSLIWTPSREDKRGSFVWTDKDLEELTSPVTLLREAAWRRIRLRKQYERRESKRPTNRPSDPSDSLAWLKRQDLATKSLAEISQLRKIVYKRAQRISLAKPDPSDARATARWQKKMDAEVAAREHVTTSLTERRQAELNAKRNAGKKLRSKSERPINFIGLTEQELVLLQSNQSSDRVKLRKLVASRIWNAELGASSSKRQNVRHAKLRADQAWLELLDFLKGVARADAERYVSQVMTAIHGLTSIEAAEHVTAIVAQLRVTAVPMRTGRIAQIKSTAGRADQQQLTRLQPAPHLPNPPPHLPLATPMHVTQPCTPSSSVDSRELFANYLKALASTASSHTPSPASPATAPSPPPHSSLPLSSPSSRVNSRELLADYLKALASTASSPQRSPSVSVASRPPSDSLRPQAPHSPSSSVDSRELFDKYLEALAKNAATPSQDT